MEFYNFWEIFYNKISNDFMNFDYIYYLKLIILKMNVENNLPTHENLDENTLIFESRFESGNLARAAKVSNNEYNLLL